MSINRRHAVAALAAAGLLWGTTVPLSKLALAWLPPGWLTVVRFGLAAAILLAVARRRGGLRAAFTPAVLAAGAVGYGGSVMVQNAGIARTSVTHAALLIGAVPVMVAIIAAVWYRAVAAPVAWFGFAVSLGGVGLVTVGGGGGGATMAGDGLVLVSLLLSATVTVAQGRLLTGRDPVAVTAVQFLGATVGALPVAVFTEGMPALPGSTGPAGLGAVLAVVALALGGTLAPFTLFAFGQSRVPAEVAGGFLNLEPLVGAIAGAAAFGDPVGLVQVAGGLAILGGIALSSLPLIAGRRAEARRAAAAPVAVPAGGAVVPVPTPLGAAVASAAPADVTAAVVTVARTAVATSSSAPAETQECESLRDRCHRDSHHRNPPSDDWRRNTVFVVIRTSKFGAGMGRGVEAAGQGRSITARRGGRPERTRPGGRIAERPPSGGRRPGGRGRGPSGRGEPAVRRTDERRGRAAKRLPARGRY
jgi:drug/metabolite transporter (DMT)-like permease